MASVFLSAPIICSGSKIRTSSSSGLTILPSFGGGLRQAPKMQISNVRRRKVASLSSNKTISCSLEEEVETLKTVQSIIAKQLSIEEATVAAATKFSDLGADSLDTVEIMMALEEKFGVSIGEGGTENISSVQDAADLIHKVKASAAVAA